jgi:hypothetical protein
MGNFSFLRKRNRIAEQSQDPNFRQIIEDTYSEYFASVRKALETISKALCRIEADLNLESGKPS